MLEAERAGAKALVVFMDDHPRNGEAWKVLRQVQNEEAHNCALIGRLLEKAGVPYSHATGEFYDKAVAMKDRRCPPRRRTCSLACATLTCARSRRASRS
jgi:nitronate monooxygenase